MKGGVKKPEKLCAKMFFSCAESSFALLEPNTRRTNSYTFCCSY